MVQTKCTNELFQVNLFALVYISVEVLKETFLFTDTINKSVELIIYLTGQISE